ncbi:MAG: hypothetical protein ACRDWG_12655 [Actinomycetes bacterium]
MDAAFGGYADHMRPTMRCDDDGWPVYVVSDTLPLATEGGDDWW